MPNTSNKVRIQNKLKELGRDGRFFKVTYNSGTGIVDDVDSLNDTVEPPKSVLANEIQQQFEIDPEMGRKKILRRRSWWFQLLLTFNAEVTLEFFEEDLLDPLPTLDDDVVTGVKLEDVTLILNRTEPEHPPEQNSGNGTAVKFTFEAVIGRK